MIPEEYRGAPEGFLLLAIQRYRSALAEPVRFDPHEILFKAPLAYAEQKGYRPPTPDPVPYTEYELVDVFSGYQIWGCKRFSARILSTNVYTIEHRCKTPHWTDPPYRKPIRTPQRSVSTTTYTSPALTDHHHSSTLSEGETR